MTVGAHAVLPVVQDGRLLGLIKAEEMIAFLDLEDAFGLFPHGTPDEPATVEATVSV